MPSKRTTNSSLPGSWRPLKLHFLLALAAAAEPARAGFGKPLREITGRKDAHFTLEPLSGNHLANN